MNSNKNNQVIRFDWAMKRLLRNKANFSVLEGFLTTLLGEKIVIQKLLESESNQEDEFDKYNRVDILAEDSKGELFLIEIQNNSEYAYFQRMLFGTSKLVTEYIELGLQITRARIDLVERLQRPFADLVARLSGAGEQASLLYEPSFAEVLDGDDPAARISQHFQRLYAGEVTRGQNLIGPQRDELVVQLNGMPAREFASNGEMWTLGLALKMAVYELLNQEYGTQPVVVLDDVFAQLDETRRAQILAFAQAQRQVIITVAAASDIPPIAGAHVIDVHDLRARMEHGEDA